MIQKQWIRTVPLITKNLPYTVSFLMLDIALAAPAGVLVVPFFATIFQKTYIRRS